MMDCSQVHFQYTETLSPADLTQLIDLFRQAAFWASDRTPEQMKTAIAHSHPVVTAWDRDRLIGFARGTSDGVFRATIWDVVIHPDYQGAGLGRRLVETLILHPHMQAVERIYLMTTNQQQFYQRVGFQENQTTTMVLFRQEFEPVPCLTQVTEESVSEWVVEMRD